MSEATQQDSERSKSFFQVRWPDDSPTQEEFLMMLPIRRSLKIWESTIINGEESIAWDTLESDMRAVSTQHPNTIFTVEIEDEDGGRWVQYHQDGQYYEAPEVRHVPDFDPSKLRETQHPDPLDLNTPIVQVPTLQEVLQEVLLKIEQDVWEMEADELPGDELPAIADPYESHGKPSTPPEAALERVPRLREILTARHQERNQFGETTGRSLWARVQKQYLAHIETARGQDRQPRKEARAVRDARQTQRKLDTKKKYQPEEEKNPRPGEPSRRSPIPTTGKELL